VNPVRSLSLGAKINIGLLLFLLLLAAAASTIIFYGFRRAQDDASERSQQALEEQGKLSLQALAAGVADSGGLQIEWAAEIGQRASRYLQESEEQQPRVAFDASRLVRTESGIWYDPDPNRASDVAVPNHVELLTPGQIEDIGYSALLNPLFPALVEGYPGELSGEGFRPIAIIFTGVNGVVRYYPPIGVHETGPPEIDLSQLYDLFGPEANPSRVTTWTPPYEDIQGRGLVLTAQTPVYQDDVFRGIFEVDLSIDGLAAELNRIRPTPSGFAFYVDINGGILRSDAFDVLYSEAGGNAALASVLDDMRQGVVEGDGATVERVTLAGREHYISYAPLPAAGGSIAVAAPINELTEQAAPITAGIQDEGTRTLQIMLGALGALFIAGLAGATYLNRRLLVAPLYRLTAATRQVAGGDLTANVALERGDELGELASDFNAMVEQLRESERVLEQRVEDRTRELTTLLEVVRNVGSTLELQPLLQLILEQLRVIAPYDRSLIMIREGDDLRVLAMRAEPGFEMEESQMELRAPIAAGGLIWELIERGEPAIIEDTDDDTALAATWRKNNERVLDVARRRVRSWMAVSIRHGDRTIGMLAASKEQPGFFTQQHAELATALGTHAGVAINNAELYQKSQHAASLEERQRLARELHDSVSQALYGIALGTRTARLRLGDDPHNASEPIDYVASLAQAGLAEMRALIFELRPESLEQEGLVAAIEKQAASIAARYKLDVHLELGEEPDCTLDAKEALYRIAQEALHNVVKHAQARRVEVGLHRSDGAIDLVVRDDGRGFDATKSFPGHVGLQSMPERANKLGGTVTVDSAAGRGTTVRASVPLRPTAAGASPATEDRAGA